MASHAWVQEWNASGVDLDRRVEASLHEALDAAAAAGGPPRLHEALEYAVFPGGARLRPRLTMRVAAACGDRVLDRAAAGAVALELVHCASLVHDDLPCFDDATLRRGRPTVHKAFGEPLALLVGDALIVMAFDVLARSGTARQVAALAAATGPSTGIIAGQAWEDEETVRLEAYHDAKTASLFSAAAALGALAADADPTPWRPFGQAVGRAYQAADDIADVLATAVRTGKTAGRDAALDRPSVVRTYGVEVARRRVIELVAAARSAVPVCEAPTLIHEWIRDLSSRLVLS